MDKNEVWVIHRDGRRASPSRYGGNRYAYDSKKSALAALKRVWLPEDRMGMSVVKYVPEVTK